MGRSGGDAAVLSCLETLVSKRTGLALTERMRSALAEAARTAARDLRKPNLLAYIEHVEGHEQAFNELVSQLVVGETYFFREVRQFDFVREEVLPRLVAAQGEKPLVRAWSAGCSSGEEAYSLAMVFERAALPSSARVLATDISRHSLAKARRARYGRWSLRGAGALLASPFLEGGANELEVVEAIRGRASFRYHNLAVDAFPCMGTGIFGLDLIMCRNVLLYLEPAVVAHVARQMYQTLTDGGWLLTSSADPPLMGLAPFETVVHECGVFYRRPAVPATSRTRRSGAFLIARAETRRSEPTPVVKARPVAPAAGSRPTGLRTRSPSGARRAVGAGAEPIPRARRPAAPRTPLRDERGQPELGVAHERDGVTGILAELERLANFDLLEAETRCSAALERHPMAALLHHLHAVFLMALGRFEPAERAARRVVYLEPELALGHFFLAAILRRGGNLVVAEQAYRNARDLSRQRPPDEPVPLSGGETMGQLAEAAAAELAILQELLR